MWRLRRLAGYVQPSAVFQVILGLNAVHNKNEKTEIIMENNRLDPTALEEEDLNWEKRLERLRQARQFNTAPTHAPLVKKSDEAVEAAPQNRT